MDSFTSFQLDITIPSGVEYVQNSVALSGREKNIIDETISEYNQVCLNLSKNLF